MRVKVGLGISGVRTSVSAWTSTGDDNTDGAQIDLIITRDDNIVNLCEMKFAAETYHITKEEEAKLRNRIQALKKTLKVRQTIHLTMITTYGIAYGKYSGIVQKQLTIDDLFI